MDPESVNEDPATGYTREAVTAELLALFQTTTVATPKNSPLEAEIAHVVRKSKDEIMKVIVERKVERQGVVKFSEEAKSLNEKYKGKYIEILRSKDNQIRRLKEKHGSVAKEAKASQSKPPGADSRSATEEHLRNELEEQRDDFERQIEKLKNRHQQEKTDWRKDSDIHMFRLKAEYHDSLKAVKAEKKKKWNRELHESMAIVNKHLILSVNHIKNIVGEEDGESEEAAAAAFTSEDVKKLKTVMGHLRASAHRVKPYINEEIELSGEAEANQESSPAKRKKPASEGAAVSNLLVIGDEEETVKPVEVIAV